MTWEMMLKERRDEGIAIGERKGRTEEKIETARNMLKNGLSPDLIIKCTGISTQQISEFL